MASNLERDKRSSHRQFTVLAPRLRMAKIPRKLSLVKFDAARFPRGFSGKYPFRTGLAYIFFGEIPNMPGHRVVADHRSEKIYSGYHTDNFIEIRKNET